MSKPLVLKSGQNSEVRSERDMFKSGSVEPDIVMDVSSVQVSRTNFLLVAGRRRGEVRQVAFRHLPTVFPLIFSASRIYKVIALMLILGTAGPGLAACGKVCPVRTAKLKHGAFRG